MKTYTFPDRYEVIFGSSDHTQVYDLERWGHIRNLEHEVGPIGFPV